MVGAERTRPDRRADQGPLDVTALSGSYASGENDHFSFCFAVLDRFSAKVFLYFLKRTPQLLGISGPTGRDCQFYNSEL